MTIEPTRRRSRRADQREDYMSAEVIAFPSKPVDEARLALVGGALRDAIPLASKDAELQLLIQIADRLVDNIVDYEVDCFIVRLDQYDARKA